MRKFLIALLLAGVAATPALADPNDNQNNRQQAHEQKQARQEARGERGDRGGNRPAYAAPQREQQYQSRQGADMAQRPQFNGGGRFQQQFDGRRTGYAGDAGVDQQRERYAAQRQAYVQQQQGYAAQRQQGERDGAWRQRQGNWQRQGYYQQNYQRGQQWDGNRDGDHRWDRNGSRDQRWSREGHSNVRWNRDWRNDQRYDWRRYRDQHRSHFHLGLYVDPFGWGYQSFNIGYRMYPAYYGNQYWIDPAMYDLPYPPPGAAWVRYWNDAVLVDTYTGTVIDVIPGFFW